MSDIPQTSRAACVVAFKEPLEIRQVPIPPDIEPGAILVQTEVASICGSDVHLWQGELGVASQTINIDDIPDARARRQLVRDWTERRGADIVIEVSGGPTAFPEGVDLVRRGGRYLVIGQVGGHTVPIEPRLVVEKQLTIVGVMSGDTDHYYKALQFLQHNRARFRFEDMLSNRYALAQVNDALESMRAWREIKPVIVM